MMTQAVRSAEATIAGYIYQFDLSALEILKSDRGDQIITIEGVEDVDVEDPLGQKVIQCKYYPASEYSLKGMRGAILPMLKTYSEGHDFQYRLYAHYRDGAIAPDKISVEELKNCLTEKKRLPEPEEVLHYEKFATHLQGFVDRFRIIIGPDIDAQRLLLKESLAKALKCSMADVEELHYDRCLAHIVDLACQKTPEFRKTTKDDLIERIDTRKIIFSRWQQEVIQKDRLVNEQSRFVKRAGMWAPTRRCCVVIGVDEVQQWISPLKEMANRLASDGRNLASHEPVTVAVAGTAEVVHELKAALIGEGVAINDGYEELRFSARFFNAQPVITRRRSARTIHRASYALRIARLGTVVDEIIDVENFSDLISFAVDIPPVLSAKASVIANIACGTAAEVHQFIRGL